ncbi:MAG: TldD/PmbA family protein [Bdellovibrionales bacterium]
MLLSENLLSKIINKGLSCGADFCEVYAEESLAYQMEIKDSKTTYISGKDSGIGIRLLYGNEELYTYTNNFNEKNLIELVEQLSFLKKRKLQQKLLDQTSFTPTFISEFPNIYLDKDLEGKKNLLQKIDKNLRSEHALISQVLLSLIGRQKQVQIANSEGLLSFDFRPYHFFKAISIAEHQGEKESGHATDGIAGDQSFFSEDTLNELTIKSGKQALKNLKAEKAPAGVFPVIINSGFGGVIFHEACGHGLETTSVEGGKSVFADKLDQKISNSCVTAYDDGTLKGKYGFINSDDEGMKAQKTTLIEKGVLKNYMVDRLGFQKTGYKKTGSARRQNYKSPPASRMRNTYIGAGESNLEDMIKDIDEGLFAESLGGGSVTPGTGNYNFAVTEARWIKKGKLGTPVKGASLIGNGLETLSKIQKVGKDLKLSPGHCGSISGWVPVTVGQPPILVSELTVGGQSKAGEGSFK